MTKEYEDLARAFGWGPADFLEIAETALAAAFCDDETRKKLAQKLESHPT